MPGALREEGGATFGVLVGDAAEDVADERRNRVRPATVRL
jgi:hypothetical protein